ncbi:hypothetical protein LEN26_002369 [Aphanomyces euteiches]|nr:hypothetical protein AeMF1_021471 [Aphanomyces euteiches]KAH9159378.1 hypothetical protein LEN26_002369 [Aphanomyces euteiches]KAH9195338.1 hypothetical protein AeNC1_002671 [Aphanomyces euteiches]
MAQSGANVGGAAPALTTYYADLDRSETNSVKTRSVGVLHVETGLTNVTKQRGKAMFNVGHVKANTLHLYPEEAYCLAHRGVLDIFTASTSATALSLREISDLLHVHVSVECRQVYCFLKERKFIPRRHRDGHNGVDIPRVSSATQLFIAYDVYAPGAKKSDQPLYCAVVFRMQDPMPSTESLSVLCKGTDMPVKLFICDGEGSVLSMEVKDGMA